MTTTTATTICLFLLFGACFGLATFSHRHLFSEGPTRPDSAEERGSVNARVLWLLVCTFLWPIMALTGVHSVLLLARRRARAARTPRP